MIPQEMLDKVTEFSAALGVLAGACAWWRRGSADEDAMVSDAADTVLDTLADADTVSRIDCLTDRNLRDQLSVEEAEELHRERELRRFGCRRN